MGEQYARTAPATGWKRYFRSKWFQAGSGPSNTADIIWRPISK
jgi:hypothetical protein